MPAQQITGFCLSRLSLLTFEAAGPLYYTYRSMQIERVTYMHVKLLFSTLSASLP
jgi:hypothetical protein